MKETKKRILAYFSAIIVFISGLTISTSCKEKNENSEHIKIEELTDLVFTEDDPFEEDLEENDENE